MTIPLRGTLKDEPNVGRRLLRRALSAVHFSPVLKINDRSGVSIAGFQDAVRREYPLLQMDIENAIAFEVRPDGNVTPRTQENVVWRMFDPAKVWRVSLTTQSISIEAEQGYSTRYDFAARIQRLVSCVHDHFAPAQLLRIGVRYVNAAEIGSGVDPRENCDPSLVSLSRHPELEQADLLWRFPIEEGELLLRSGVLLPNMSHDPGVLASVQGRSWYLDIDVASQVAGDFDSAHIGTNVASLVRRAHAIYSWAIPQSVPQDGGLSL